MEPSKDWKETVAPDETERFEKYATILADLQRGRGGTTRALHAKQHAGVRASFDVLDVPEHLRIGPFAERKTYEAYARFSNGSSVRASDDKPDVRAIAIKLLGVPGTKLIPGMEDETTQDFLMLNTPALAFRSVAEFVALAQSSKSQALLPLRLFGRLGFSAFGLISRLLASTKKTTSLATETYYSVAPIRFGDYAARLSLAPHQTDAPERTAVLADELAARLARGPLAWDFRVQLFVDEAHTPIEDTSRAWDEGASPHVTLARLTLPRQDVASDEGKTLFDRVESLAFDPWHALVELRPLGEAMRARSPAYRESQKTRRAAKEPR